NRRRRRRVIRKHRLGGFLEELRCGDQLIERNAALRKLPAGGKNAGRIAVHVLAQQGVLVSEQRRLKDVPELGFRQAALVSEMQNVELVPVGNDFPAAIADRFQYLAQLLEIIVPQKVEVTWLSGRLAHFATPPTNRQACCMSVRNGPPC